MGFTRAIKRFWYGPPHITRAEDLASGKVVVEGKAAALEKMITSPLTGTDCIAYFYRASYKTPSRTQGVAERLLKEIQVYSPSFALNLEGGKIKVIPVSSDEFDGEEHRKLQSGEFMGFSAKEQLIRPGTRVRALGTVKDEGEDGFILRSKKIEILAEEPMSQADRAQRQKQKKKKKKKKKG